MRLDLVVDELDQVDSIWGRTRHGAKPAATPRVTAYITTFECDTLFTKNKKDYP